VAILQWSNGNSSIENGPVARGYRFWKRVHRYSTQNMKSVTAGGRGSPPLHRIFWTMMVQKLGIQKGAGGHGGPPLRGGTVNNSQISECPMAIQMSKIAL
jgi:hypothetical protein